MTEELVEDFWSFFMVPKEDDRPLLDRLVLFYEEAQIPISTDILLIII
jgi:hypothetical protein